MDNIPNSLLPDLESLGIDSPEGRGICEDTYENRRILRFNKLQWQVMYDDEGQLTGNILALSPKMLAARAEDSLSRRSALRVDPRNPDSDYETGYNLLLISDVDELIPYWVSAATKEWNRVERLREDNPDKKISPSLLTPPSRCAAIKASDGLRCQNWTTGRDARQMCKTHLGSDFAHKAAPAAMVDRARTRLQQAAGEAVGTLEKLMESAESEPVRLNAAKEILDRAGVRGGIEIDANVNVDIHPAAEILNSRLKDMAQKAAEKAAIEEAARLAIEAANTEDAVIVEETEVPVHEHSATD